MSPQPEHVESLVDDYLAHRIDRRQFFRRAAAIGLSLPAASGLLAACGGGGGSTGASGAPPTTLKLRLLNDIANLDPAFFPAAADYQVLSAVNEGLVTYKPGTLQVTNQLAETFQPSSDGLSYDFTLKKGIQFHGSYGEVTADDVKFSFERIAGLTKPKVDSPYRGDWAPALKEVKVKDKYSGTIVLKQPFAAIMRSTLPVGSGYVLSRRAVEERGKKYATHPIGTGPYEFVSWTPKQSVLLKRFAKYGGATPKALLGSPFKEIRFLPITDDNAANIALETGDVDFGEIALDSIERFQQNSGFTVRKQTTLNYNWIGMNMLHPKLKDIRVRQAIRAAVDVPSILQAAFEGKMTRATSIIPPNMGLGFWKDAPVHERDVDQAKSLLQQAGVSNLALELIFTEETGSKDLGQIVQQNLADVGIKLSLNQVDSAALYELGKNLRDRELFYVGYVTEPDPSWSTVWFTCRQFDEWNWMYWCDKEFNSLHFAALRELDDAKRNAMYIEMQKRWDAASHTIWTHWPTQYYGVRKGITPSIYPTGYFLPQGFEAA